MNWIKKFLSMIQTSQTSKSKVHRKLDGENQMISLWETEQHHYDDIYKNHANDLVSMLQHICNGTHDFHAVYHGGSLILGPLWDKFSSVAFHFHGTADEINCPDEILFWLAKCYVKNKTSDHCFYSTALEIINQFGEKYDHDKHDNSDRRNVSNS